VVVLYQENVSFDHYFGTYPRATNTDGQPFTAKPGTPTVNGLTPALLTQRREPATAGAGKRPDLRPESLLHAGAARRPR